MDAGNLDHDIMLGFDRDDGVCCHLNANDDFEMGRRILTPPLHLRR
jgi:hypothetical protein